MLLISCKKDVADTPATIEITFSANALAYVQLPVNKYFIYKDSATGVMDSVVVTQSNMERLFTPKHESTGIFDQSVPAYYYQRLSLLLTKYNGTSKEDWFYGIAEAFSFYISASDTATLSLRERDRANNADKNYVFNSSFGNASYGPVLAASVLPAITVEGKTFTNAVVYMSANGLDATQSYYLKSTYYWVKGIGIIKRTIQTNTSLKTDLLVRNN